VSQKSRWELFKEQNATVIPSGMIKKNTSLTVRERSCGTCTKCCEGYLSGEVRGIPFFKGKPCHFIKTNSGCSIYEDRPEDPCKGFKCLWLTDQNLPEWLKPNLSNAMFVPSVIDSHDYIFAIEAGEKMDARVLSWAVAYMSFNKLNFAWQYDGVWSAIGSDRFVKAYFGDSGAEINEIGEIV
jgi:hypothetical protein